MNVEETKKAAEIMLAWAEEKTIQCRECGISSWYTMPKPKDGLCEIVEWDFSHYEYRIKPEPHYRPFKSAEEVMEAIKEHGGFIKDPLNSRFVFITGIDNDGIWWDDNMARCSMENATGYTFADGTPFGKLED